MDKFIAIVEKIAGYFIGFLAVIVFSEAILRYVFNSHIPDGFVLAQMTQGIAICWGIAATTYADRHISVDLVYAVAPKGVRRGLDVFSSTIMLLFLMAFGYATIFKVFDIYGAGESSSELLIPTWIGYMFAAFGILAAVLMGAIRWYQVVFLKR